LINRGISTLGALCNGIIIPFNKTEECNFSSSSICEFTETLPSMANCNQFLRGTSRGALLYQSLPEKEETQHHESHVMPAANPPEWTWGRLLLAVLTFGISEGIRHAAAEH